MIIETKVFACCCFARFDSIINNIANRSGADKKFERMCFDPSRTVINGVRSSEY